MLSIVRRTADKTIDLFLPKAEAKADTWGRYCGCRGFDAYYEKWTYGPGGVPVNLGCKRRYHLVCAG